MIVTTEQKPENKPLSKALTDQPAESGNNAASNKRNGRSNKRVFWSIVSIILFALLTVQAVDDLHQ